MSRRSWARLRAAVCACVCGVLLPAGVSSAAVVLDAGGSPTATDPALRLWLDASDVGTLFQDTAGASPVTAAGQTVARWNDKSSVGLNVTQATADRRPIYRDAVANLQGRPALGFFPGAVGNVDSLDALNGTGIDGNDDRTVVTVWSNAVDNGLNYQHTFHMGDPTASEAYGHSAFRGTGSNRIGNHYYNSGFDTTIDGSASPTYAISIWDGDGGTTTSQGRDTWFVNGVAAGSISRAPLLTGVDQVRIGSRLNGPSEGVSGDLAEVIVYNSTLTTAEREALQGYLFTKYGIVPEPSTAAAAMIGAGLLGFARRRRRRRSE